MRAQCRAGFVGSHKMYLVSLEIVWQGGALVDPAAYAVDGQTLTYLDPGSVGIDVQCTAEPADGWRRGHWELGLSGSETASAANPETLALSPQADSPSYWTWRAIFVQQYTTTISQVFGVSNTPNPVRDVHTTRFEVQGVGIHEILVRIFDLSGRLVSDSGWQEDGYDWHVQSGAGEALANGAYVCVVSVQGIDGQTAVIETQELVVYRQGYERPKHPV